MDMDLSRPRMAVRPIISGVQTAVLTEDRLVAALGELEGILSEVERLKSIAVSAEDWRVVMLYIAGQKVRISELASYAKKSYVQEFARAYDAQFSDISEGQKPPTARAAEIRARSDAGLSYEASERFERTWKDLDSLTWACKDVAGSLDGQEHEAAIFHAYPEHMFQSSSSSSSDDDEAATAF